MKIEEKQLENKFGMAFASQILEKQCIKSASKIIFILIS